MKNMTCTIHENGRTIKQYLKEELHLSRREITCLLQAKTIKVNEQNAPLTQLLHTDDVLELTFTGKDEGKQELKEGILEILYEDEVLVAVNKPAGLSCHATALHDDKDMGTLLKMKYGQDFTIRCIGRLDQGVSGVCLYAKDQKTAALLSKQRDQNKLHKTYAGLCEGHFEKQSGHVRTHMKKEKGIRGNSVCEEGKLCITDYTVVHEYKDCTLLDIEIQTGRTHQIRSTLASLHHPLLGDRLYGKDRRLSRPALHCRRITFIHPCTKETVRIEAPIPMDFKNAMK